MPLDAPADRYYAQVRQQLTRNGAPIDPNDLHVATQAPDLDLALVTAKEGEFARVPRLGVENRLAD